MSDFDKEEPLASWEAAFLPDWEWEAYRKEDDDGPEWRRDTGKRQRARRELEDEGVLQEYTQAEQEERAKVTGFSMGPDIERYYLVRCDIDCMCFGGVLSESLIHSQSGRCRRT